MNFLFVHQNFPGQFRHAARALAADPGNTVVCVGETRNLKDRPALHPAIRLLAYEPHGGGGRETHHYLREHESHVRRGQSLVRLLMGLREQGFRPDVVAAHPGWGEGLFLKDVFPEARHVQYFEYYYHGTGGDVGFDPEFPSSLDDRLRIRLKNATQLHSLVACDQGLSPTRWQYSRYPAEFRAKIEVCHDGIDTAVARPDATAGFSVDGLQLRAGDEVVTYVARNLEPYRGFHTFVRSLPRLQALRPSARVVVVGGDEVSYGRKPAEGTTYRQQYLAEVEGRVDLSRVHFTGKLPYADYLRLLQVSAAHVYLTYPFVLSWSMLEAMASGCALVASATPPVQEVVEDGRNGLLTGFFDADALAGRVAEVLARPEHWQSMRKAARDTVLDRYDLRTVCLPRILSLLTGSH